MFQINGVLYKKNNKSGYNLHLNLNIHLILSVLHVYLTPPPQKKIQQFDHMKSNLSIRIHVKQIEFEYSDKINVRARLIHSVIFHNSFSDVTCKLDCSTK